jgi:hypothetical protein
MSGTAAAPGLTPAGDANTGLYSPGADQVAISTGGTGRLFVDASGNVGVGITGGTLAGGTAFQVKSGINAAHVTAQGSDASSWLQLYSGTNAADNTALIWNSTSALRFATTTALGTIGFTERARIDSSGRLLVGTSTSISQFGLEPRAQVTGTSGAGSYLGLTVFNTAVDSAPSLVLGHSKGATVGTYAASVTSDLMGEVSFTAGNGTDMRRGASIGAYADGGWGTNDHPGRLIFSTTADGGRDPAERMRIKSTGVVNIASTTVHADNTAAKAGGLVAGDIYRKADGTLMIAF